MEVKVREREIGISNASGADLRTAISTGTGWRRRSEGEMVLGLSFLLQDFEESRSEWTLGEQEMF